jgi:hypothetical protein
LRRLLPSVAPLSLIAAMAAAVAGCAPSKSFEPGGPFEHWITTFPAALKAYRDVEGRWPSSGPELSAFCTSHDINIDPKFLRRVRFNPEPDGALVTVWHDGDELFGSRWRWVNHAPLADALGPGELRCEWRRRDGTLSN